MEENMPTKFEDVYDCLDTSTIIDALRICANVKEGKCGSCPVPEPNERPCIDTLMGAAANRLDELNALQIIHCKDCKSFMEYSDEYRLNKNAVEGADGDCFYRALNSEFKQYIAVQKDDFCSWAKRRDDKQ